MSDTLHAKCPSCGKEENIGIVPTFYLGVRIEGDVIVTSCSECGYDE